jgi:hypothetical protein
MLTILDAALVAVNCREAGQCDEDKRGNPVASLSDEEAKGCEHRSNGEPTLLAARNELGEQ